MLLRHPSRGTKAVIFLPFLISCTRTHFRIAELGCLASTPLSNNKINYSYYVHTNVCKTAYYYVMLYIHFFQYNAFGMGSTTKWISFPSSSQVSLFIVFVIPSLFTSMICMFASRAKTSRFTYKTR
jgi:hypothetical protein